ncbi:hypothetical protein [Cellulomonas sp. PhB150]|uniref:hypothetical protein n=1 Tax=Cellulomonas sp. PhB150 TaxID=2485188 RepID=UPI000F483D2B|nr:hypothetical protein [Cellulomonas sp. PhB150]ROS23957.1 hypothetical protein EDF34_3020 [Cellulomonas sp. PhB150]
MNTSAWLATLPPTVALIVGVITIVQRNRADKRAEWWRRAQWALDHMLSSNPERVAVGAAVADVLSESKLAGDDELTVLARFSVARMDISSGDSDTESGGGEP